MANTFGIAFTVTVAITGIPGRPAAPTTGVIVYEQLEKILPILAVYMKHIPWLHSVLMVFFLKMKTSFSNLLNISIFFIHRVFFIFYSRFPHYFKKARKKNDMKHFIA